MYISGKIGPAGIGLLQLILSVGAMAMTAGIAGIRTATMYLTAAELGRSRKENVCHILSSCFLYSILCSGTVSTGLYLFAPQIADGWIGNAQAADAIRLLAVFLPVCCLCGVMSGYFTAAGKIGTLAIVQVAEQILSMAVTLSALTLWARDSAEKACSAVVFGSSTGACLTLFLLTLLRILERSPKGKPFPIRKRLLDIAVPLAIADDCKVGINTVENLMVPKRLSLYTGAVNPLAMFGTVCGMVFPILMFPAAIVFSLAELLIPEMARCSAAGSKIRIQYLAKRSLRIVLIYGCVCGGILFALSELLCLWLYDNVDAGKHLAIYAFLAPMLYCDSIIDAINKGLGQQKIAVRYNILTAILDVLLLFLLLPKLGMQGYFISFLVTHLLNFVLSLRLLVKTSGIAFSPKTPVITALSTVTALAISSAVPMPTMRCLVFILIFGSLLTLCGIISRQDLHWIKGLLRVKNQITQN